MSAGPVWLQGDVAGVPPALQPVAHALIEANQDVAHLLGRLTAQQVAARPGTAASVGFHLRHAMGSLDRLFTYARGESLSPTQLAALAAEKSTPDHQDPAELAAQFSAATERALAQLRATDPDALFAVREVGRAKLPSTALGLLAHAGAHTYRHVGQAITTVKSLGLTV